MKFDPNEALSSHFRLREFLHAGAIESLTPEIHLNLLRLAAALEKIRAQFANHAIHINSGYRTLSHNRTVGGTSNSQHLYGLAADITIDGHMPQDVQKKLENWPGGLGSYDTWTHVDLGPKRRWKG
jgi:uncharacterized protein YcbK (DUF882 family)